MSPQSLACQHFLFIISPFAQCIFQHVVPRELIDCLNKQAAEIGQTILDVENPPVPLTAEEACKSITGFFSSAMCSMCAIDAYPSIQAACPSTDERRLSRDVWQSIGTFRQRRQLHSAVPGNHQTESLKDQVKRDLQGTCTHVEFDTAYPIEKDAAYFALVGPLKGPFALDVDIKDDIKDVGSTDNIKVDVGAVLANFESRTDQVSPSKQIHGCMDTKTQELTILLHFAQSSRILWLPFSSWVALLRHCSPSQAVYAKPFPIHFVSVGVAPIHSRSSVGLPLLLQESSSRSTVSSRWALSCTMVW